MEQMQQGPQGPRSSYGSWMERRHRHAAGVCKFYDNTPLNESVINALEGGLVFRSPYCVRRGILYLPPARSKRHIDQSTTRHPSRTAKSVVTTVFSKHQRQFPFHLACPSELRHPGERNVVL